MVTRKFLKWEEIDSVWEDIKRDDDFMLWEDIALIEEVEEIIKKGGGAGIGSGTSFEISNREYVSPWKTLQKKLGEEKTEKFIKIYCNVNNIEYENKKKVREDIKVTVDNLQKVFDLTKVKVNIKK